MAHSSTLLHPDTGMTATPPSLAHRQRSDSNFTLVSSDSDVTNQHWPKKSQAYMDSLVPPSRENFERIAQIQEQKEQELRLRDKEHRRQTTLDQKLKAGSSSSNSSQNERERDRAARLIQKTFRGHRTRREMEGYSLDASTRWVSALREAEFREMIRPRARSDAAGSANPLEDGPPRGISNARWNWKKASIVARRAGHDDAVSDISSEESSDDDEESQEEKDKIRHLRDKILAGRRSQAQMMGLQYFLEMVDLKHRYGSNLRIYHSEWQKSDTKENFFYWLDFGEGKNIELDSCPRDRLEREKVRYLSREERQYYLVEVDDEGRLRWAKNGVCIDTTEQYRDSIHGIVPVDDPTPAFNPHAETHLPLSLSSGGRSRSSSLSSLESRREADRAAKYNDPSFEQQSNMKKITHFSASTIWNKMLRRSVRDGTWIFVADTSFRLYVGIKASGAFQHSSFLQGSRISAAGLIKIKNGRISSLSPLSGHYRPPTSNFRAFVKSLKEAGVDMSHVSISKAYAVLVGLEVYIKSRKKGKKLIQDMMHRKDKIVAPEEAHKREEEAKDQSQSAQREREVIQKEEVEREENKTAAKMMDKLKTIPVVPKTHAKEQKGLDENSGNTDTSLQAA